MPLLTFVDQVMTVKFRNKNEFHSICTINIIMSEQVLTIVDLIMTVIFLLLKTNNDLHILITVDLIVTVIFTQL